MSELINTYLGQYHLQEIIRHGGMAVVYKAHQDSLDRYVAVKVLPNNQDPQFATRFKREARAIAQLQHPNILPVYDYGEQDGLLYLVVQYIENGTTLSDMLGTPMEPVTALRLTARVLAALEYAHQRGIIHRDIKPSNVLMPSPTWPLLADFGIAKLLNVNSSQNLTMPGVFMGTPAYVAPEQAFGAPIDARTDLYSLGVVLYEMLTGRIPFEADTPMTMLGKHAYEPPPPPRSINPDLPAVVEPILLRLLAKDPADRYQSADLTAEALERVAVQIEQGRARDRLANLYQAGVQSFEEGRWDLAVERLGELTAADPGYEDAADLLVAAQEAQVRSKTEARQQLERVQQRRQSLLRSQIAVPPPAETAPSAPDPAPTGAAALPAGGTAVPPAPAPEEGAAQAARKELLPAALLGQGGGAAAARPVAPAGAARRRNPMVLAAIGLAVVVFGGGLLFRLLAGPGAPGTPTHSMTPGTGPAAVGSLRFNDGSRVLDEATLAVKGLPPPAAGTRYEGWLFGEGGEQRQSMDRLNLDTEGQGDLVYRDASGRNLLQVFDQFEITTEPDPDTNPAPSGQVVYAGALPTASLKHIRHLLVAFDTTADKKPLAGGLLQQATVLNDTTQALLAAQQNGDLAGMKRAAEGLVNLIAGPEGDQHADHDGDGTVTDPGDGFGLLLNGTKIGYIQGTLEHARLAAAAPDATANVKLHGAHVGIAAQNLSEWAVELRRLGLRLATGTSVTAAGDDAAQAVALADRFLNGKDLDGNEAVDPAPGEGGAKTAYQHARYMADVAVVRNSDGGAAGPATAVAPTAQAPATPTPGQEASPTPPAPPAPTATAAEAAPTETAPPPPPPTEAAPPPPPAGTEVFAEDFNHGPTNSGLDDLDDVLGAEFSRGFHTPGVYHFKLSQPDERRWVVLPRLAYTNFSMQIDLWDNSDQFIGSVAQGLIFRVRDNDHFYALLFNPRDKHYSVIRQDGAGNWSEVLPRKPAPGMKQKKDVNQVRLDAVGDTFTIYLNGAVLDSFQDQTYSSGMIGLITANEDAGEPHMHFDNLQIWSSDTPAAAPDLPPVREAGAGALVLIADGEFIMGGNETRNEGAHMLALPSFYIDRTEVTNTAYAQCVAAGRCTPPRSPASATHPSYYTDQSRYGSFPVIHVSWEQARDFCTWADKRLPTEAEWEKAASWNGTTRQKVVWPWDNVFDAARLNSAESNNGDTTAVGQFPPEVNGTVDMAGNVWEWTSSLHQPYPYSATDGREDPQAPGDRVSRGGSWAQTQGKARGFVRLPTAPTFADREIGIRCAVTP